MDPNSALDIIHLLAKAWADKTEGDVAHAFAQIAGLAGEAVEQSRALDASPVVPECEHVWLHNVKMSWKVCDKCGERR